MITDIISGDLEFDSSKFYYNKIINNSKIKVEMENTATGIKSFGIIQVLNDNKFFDRKNLLILDEPEVHLHPKWQLKMAGIIVKLVKSGAKIVVNTHSPYMIQALIKYARDYKIVDKSNFYLTQKENEMSVIEDVNDNLNKIFELLAEPMNEVYE
ncbi:MAG: AAA family ATPase [Sulfurovum sp.]|nr:AAA family ATPase [Sulfurovum sp.]